MRKRTVAGVLLLGGVAAYFLAIERQIHAAEALCDANPVGGRIENIDQLEGASFLARRGPFAIRDRADAERFIFCAGMTLCEYSCMLEIENGRVTTATFTGTRP